MQGDLSRPSRAAVEAVLRGLSRELGEHQLFTDPDLLEPYGRDWSGAEPVLPDLVVKAESTADVQVVLRTAQTHGVPVTPRGLGSGKAGGCIPIAGGVVLSLERLNRIKEIDRENLTVTAGAGVITADLMQEVEALGLFYPPDPNSLKICSIGGNVACNAGGPRALKYGVTKNYVLELEVVLANGEAMMFGKRTIKHVTGYDLASLIVGSEGTLGVITEVTMRLVPKPAAIQTALVSFTDAEAASLAVSQVIAGGVVPRTLELLDEEALSVIRKKTPGRFPEQAGALFILETDGATEERAFEDLARAAELCQKAGALEIQVAQDAAQRERIWEPRRILSLTLTESAEAKISEDVVVPRTQIPQLLRAVRRIGAKYGLRTATYGHAGDGNLHVNVLFRRAEAELGQKAVEEVLKETITLGGTISGEHGIGLNKRDFLPLEHSLPKLALQRALKATLDPHHLLNPGKILPRRGPTE